VPENPYIIPPYGASGDRIHGWLLEGLQEGQSWLKAQQPATEWQAILDLLSVPDTAFIGRSRVSYNKAKRLAREMVASLTNFRHEGEYKVEHDQALYSQAMALSKLDRAWYTETHVYQRYREVMQYAVALGTGYLVQEWDKHFHGPFKGDIRLTALSPEDVFCIQMPKDHDLQRSYMVLIRYELPINLARRIYAQTNAAWAARLQPDRNEPGWLEKGLKKVQALLGGSPVLNLGRDRRDRGAFPTVDVFHAYTLDDAINQSGGDRVMGALGTNWSYKVPSLGADIDTGQRHEGEVLSRKATAADALLFPLRRLSIFTRTVNFPCYDGSSPWWHGQVPIVRFRFNDQPWEALGQSLIGDVRGLQKSVESIMEDVEDSSHARLDPPMLYDDNHVNKAWAEAINPRKAGVRAAAPLQTGEVAKVFGEQWQYEVPEWIPGYVETLKTDMDYLTGTPDLVAIAKAKQVPSDSTLEKLLEMAGPLVQDMIRNVEEPLHQLGTMRLAYYFQFYTMPRILQVAGDYGKEGEQFAFTPELIVPLKQDESNEQRGLRVKRYLHEFKYKITQSGINEIHRLSTKLFYLQLMKANFPIDWWTFADIAQIPNFGPKPMGADNRPVETVIERWMAQQHMTHELQGELASETNGTPQAPSAQPAAGGPPSGNPPVKGRPPVNTGPAKIVSKDGGARSTVTTSAEG
jgi:hypothetical protein